MLHCVRGLDFRGQALSQSDADHAHQKTEPGAEDEAQPQSVSVGHWGAFTSCPPKAEPWDALLSAPGVPVLFILVFITCTNRTEPVFVLTDSLSSRYGQQCPLWILTLRFTWTRWTRDGL